MATAAGLSVALCRLLTLRPAVREWHWGAHHSGAAGELSPYDWSAVPTNSGRKIKNRRRHLLVAAGGARLKTKASPTGIHDRAWAELL